jgi:endo-1,4-beta-xylanase
MNKGIFNRYIFLTILAVTLMIFQPGCNSNSSQAVQAEKGLKDYYANNFLIGVALPPGLLNDSVSAELIKKNFNSITAENHMKWAMVHPSLDSYSFENADKYLEFASSSQMKLIGHTLVWHSQLGRGVFSKDDSYDSDDPVDSETLLKRIRDHIFTVAGRYRGKIHGWDVVNEALNEDGTLRESPFLKIAGEAYIEKAFEYAAEADPDAELYYNDYDLVSPEKRHGAIRLIKNLQNKGLKIDAVGLQAHWDMEFPTLEEIERSILEFSQLGIKVMFTELDISVLPVPMNRHSADISMRFENNEKMNPYPDGLPGPMEEALAKRYSEIFALFNRHREAITRVTFWGLHDGMSWKNNFPIMGRTDYPLVFDRNMKPKKAFSALIELMSKNETQ